MQITILIIIMFLLLSLIFVDLYSKPSKINYFILLIVIVALSLFSAYRSEIIPDTKPYIEYYETLVNDVSKNGFFNYTNIMEIGYEYLSRFCIVLGMNYVAFFFVVSMIQSILFVFIARKITKRHIILAFVLFYSFYGLYFQFIILRAGISVLVFFFAIFNCKKGLPRLVMFFVSFLFHFSAIFGIACYYIFTAVNFKVTLRLAFYSIIIFIPIYILGVNKIFIDYIAILLPEATSNTPLFYNKVYFYIVNYGETTYKIPFRLIVNTIIFLWSLYVIEKYKFRRNKKLNVLISTSYIAIIVILLFGAVVPILRLSDYIMLSNVFLLVFIISRIRVKNISTLCLYKTNEVGKKIIVYNKLYIVSLVTIYALFNLLFVYRITQNI